MRAVVQRVARARVSVAGRVTGEIACGVLALVGVSVDDGDADARWMASKIAHLRIFEDDAGLINRLLLDAGGSALVVSQFTLLADTRRGRRPSFVNAAKEPAARELYERVGSLIAAEGVRVAYGEFGADMAVELLNEGPVTIVLDSPRD